jgi:hypothetical protein
METRFKPCSVDGCARNAHRDGFGKKGMCAMHYQRAKKSGGDPSIVGRRPSPALDWIEAHKDYAGDSCLRWPFAIGKDGYGKAHYKGTSRLTNPA